MARAFAVCRSIYLIIFILLAACGGAASPSPAIAPDEVLAESTAAPEATPMPEPTATPTPIPTEVPTETPTEEPTQEPTPEPTPDRLSGEALIQEVEANVTIRCDYVDKEVEVYWPTQAPLFRINSTERSKMEADPELCYLEEDEVHNWVKLNPENSSYRALLALATRTKLVVDEYVAKGEFPEEVVSLEQYAGLTAEEIVA